MTASAESGLPAALPVAGAEVYTCAADDANAHAGNLLGWSQLYDQLSAGSFQGAIEGVCTDGLHVFREATNASLRQSCVVQSDAWWFGIPVREESCFRLDARFLEGHAIAVRRGRQAFELVTPQAFEIYGIVVPREKLQQHLQSLNLSHMLREREEVLSADAAPVARLRHLLAEILQQARLHPRGMRTASAREAMEQTVLDGVAAACCHRTESPEVKRTERQHSLLVRNVREYLLSLEDRVASVPELCRNFAVSRRTLQYAFEQVLGMGPNAYLKLLRLNGVRRDLARRGTLVKSVQQVAADWGFWHLSQFSKDYKQHFEELPSATLKRAMESRGR